MKQAVLILLFLFVHTLPEKAVLHPLHLSVTNIRYENGTLEILVKTFRDDWELAYFHFHGEVIDFSKPEMRKNQWFNAYLLSKFRIEAQRGEALDLQTGNVSCLGNDMQISLKADLQESPGSLYIYNALLTDIYPDQSNLVIFVFGKRETGIKFDVSKDAAEIMLQ